MAKKSKKERAQEFLESDDYTKKLLALIPEADRDAVLERLGDGVLRQDDYSRLAQEAQTARQEAETAKALGDKVYQENVKWRADSLAEWEKKQAELAAKESAISTAATSLDPSKFLSKEDAAKLYAQQRQQADGESLAFIEAVDEIKARHFKSFGEFLTTREIVAHARKVGKPVDAAYEDMTRERYTEKAAKDAKAAEQALRDRITQEVKSSLGPAAIYPLDQTDSMGNNTLGGLKPAAAETPKFGVAAAVAAMQRGEVNPRA